MEGQQPCLEIPLVISVCLTELAEMECPTFLLVGLQMLHPKGPPLPGGPRGLYLLCAGIV